MIFSPEDLKQARDEINAQKVSTGFSKSVDDKFPVHSLKLQANQLVYIPKTLVSTNAEGVEVLEPVKMLGHQVQDGKYKSIHRCINGFDTEFFKEKLGYNGSCPYCAAANECWELYNKELAAIAEQKGVDPKNDEANVLQEDKRKLANNRVIENAEAYVAFPIVIIPNTNNSVTPTADALEHLEPHFVIWKESQYKERIESQLMNFVGKTHMGGMVMTWNYIYDTKGAQPDKMQAGKNAKYSVVPDQSPYASMLEKLEEAAAPFTEAKVYEVLVQYSFDTLEKMTNIADKTMSQTRMMLEVLDGKKDEKKAVEGQNAPKQLVGAEAKADAVLSEFNLDETELAEVMPEDEVKPPKSAKTSKTTSTKVSDTEGLIDLD